MKRILISMIFVLLSIVTLYGNDSGFYGYNPNPPKIPCYISIHDFKVQSQKTNTNKTETDDSKDNKTNNEISPSTKVYVIPKHELSKGYDKYYKCHLYKDCRHFTITNGSHKGETHSYSESTLIVEVNAGHYICLTCYHKYVKEHPEVIIPDKYLK